MIKRIVKLTFAEGKTAEFMKVFEKSKAKIRAVEGCYHMELLQDCKQPNILFTFSIWRNEEALNAYRHSKLFEKTWAKTKALFGGKPEAWSVVVLDAPDFLVRE